MSGIDPLPPFVNGRFRVHNCHLLAYVLRIIMTRIRSTSSLYLISWIGVPVVFATFVGVEYHRSVAENGSRGLRLRLRCYVALHASHARICISALPEYLCHSCTSRS
jgi:hypothetical protein